MPEREQVTWLNSSTNVAPSEDSKLHYDTNVNQRTKKYENIQNNTKEYDEIPNTEERITTKNTKDTDEYARKRKNTNIRSNTNEYEC